jgi:hypothetical protein
VIRTATTNEARFDHNPTTGESLGLLVEEQRANLLLQSNGFDTTWTNSLSTETANAGTAPDGTNTAWELKDTVDAVASQHFLLQTPASFVSGTNYTFSIWAKSGTLTHIALTLPSAAFGATLTTRYNLATGTAVSVAAGTVATVTAFPNNWYRVTTTAAATASSSGSLNIRLAVAGTTSYQGDGTGTILIWGAQLEAGSFPTSYIPTTTAAVTRSADVVSISGSNFSSWFTSPNENTFYFEAIKTQHNSPSGCFFAGGNGVNIFGGGNINFDSSGTRLRVQSRHGSVRGDTGSNAPIATAGSLMKGVLTTSTTTFGAAVNGQILTGNPILQVDWGTALTLGWFPNGGYSVPLNGTIRRLTFWPSRLPDATLQGITQQ